MTIDHVAADAPRYSVRPATPADAHMIASLQVQALEVTLELAGGALPDDVATDLEKQWEATLTQATPDGCATLVAIHGTQVVGFASVYPTPEIPADGQRPHDIPAASHVDNFLIDQNFQRSGHGSRLLSAIIDVLKPRCLHMWVRGEDEPRIRFLQSAGFAPAGIRRRLHATDGDKGVAEFLWWATVSSATDRI